MRRLLAFIACLWLVAPGAALSAPAPESFADLVEELSPAVVNISTRQTIESGGDFSMRFHGVPDQQLGPFKEFFERFNEGFGGGAPAKRDVSSLGSGFVIDASGYIVTNNHVIEKADEIDVIFQDETRYEAKIVGRDSKTDLALLKIEASDLPYVKFGDSDALRVGDWVVAIGNPFGLGGSVSAGIVSARSRNINAGPFDDFIQTDAAINRGNSGGPLFNTKGEVIGVNSAIFSPSGGNIGIGFSISSALAKPVLKQLKEHGRTYRGWLGIRFQPITDELAESLGMKGAEGALVVEVIKGGPAAEAGVKTGDVIIEFDGRPVKESMQLPRMVAEAKIGKNVRLKVWRDERERVLQVKLGELDEQEQVASDSSGSAAKNESASSTPQSWMGAQVATLNKALRKRAGIEDMSVKGVIVMKVPPGSAAFEAKLMRADVIMQANLQEVRSPKALKEAIANARGQGKKHALLRVHRRGVIMFVTVPTE